MQTAHATCRAPADERELPKDGEELGAQPAVRVAWRRPSAVELYARLGHERAVSGPGLEAASVCGDVDVLCPQRRDGPVDKAERAEDVYAVEQRSCAA